MPKHVVIVDDDELWRAKIKTLVEANDGLTVDASATHAVAVEWCDEWKSVDVVLVDAGDIRRDDDHFPGVGVVHQIRKCVGEDVLIIVITGHYLDDALRWRMREAKADYFYHRLDIQDANSLFEAILHPKRARKGVPDVQDLEAAFRVGVVRSARVEDGLSFVREHELLDPEIRRSSPRSRRWLRMREDFNRVARLHTVNSDGTVPDREQVDPSFDQIGRFYRWATRAKQAD